MLINYLGGIPAQWLHISNNYNIHFKCLTILIFNYSSIKLKKIWTPRLQWASLAILGMYWHTSLVGEARTAPKTPLGLSWNLNCLRWGFKEPQRPTERTQAYCQPLPYPCPRSVVGKTCFSPQDVLSLSGRKDVQNNTKWKMILKSNILLFLFISVFLFTNEGGSHISKENKDSLPIV